MARADFLDRFYDEFLASSPRVREKFARTDLDRQKAALRASLPLMHLAAQQEGTVPPVFLESLARRHGASQLAVGAEFYDLWLDSLLKAVQASDPRWSPELGAAWERVMGVGIAYLLTRFNP
jgi:hemoglobin-like flavoprotein